MSCNTNITYNNDISLKFTLYNFAIIKNIINNKVKQVIYEFPTNFNNFIFNILSNVILSSTLTFVKVFDNNVGNSNVFDDNCLNLLSVDVW